MPVEEVKDEFQKLVDKVIDSGILVIVEGKKDRATFKKKKI